MHPRLAARTLGVELGEVTEAQVRTAAADAMARAHPDNGGDPALAPKQIALAKQAREALVRHLQGTLPEGQRECPPCGGTGQIRAAKTFRSTPCPRCKGSGHVPL